MQIEFKNQAQKKEVFQETIANQASSEDSISNNAANIMTT